MILSRTSYFSCNVFAWSICSFIDLEYKSLFSTMSCIFRTDSSVTPLLLAVSIPLEYISICCLACWTVASICCSIRLFHWLYPIHRAKPTAAPIIAIFPVDISPPSPLPIPDVDKRIIARLPFLVLPSCPAKRMSFSCSAEMSCICRSWTTSELLTSPLRINPAIWAALIFPSANNCAYAISFIAFEPNSCCWRRIFCWATSVVILPSMTACIWLFAYILSWAACTDDICKAIWPVFKLRAFNPQLTSCLPARTAPKDKSNGLILSSWRIKAAAPFIAVLNTPPIILSPSANLPSMISHASINLFHCPNNVSDKTNCIL